MDRWFMNRCIQESLHQSIHEPTQCQRTYVSSNTRLNAPVYQNQLCKSPKRHCTIVSASMHPWSRLNVSMDHQRIIASLSHGDKPTHGGWWVVAQWLPGHSGWWPGLMESGLIRQWISEPVDRSARDCMHKTQKPSNQSQFPCDSTTCCWGLLPLS